MEDEQMMYTGLMESLDYSIRSFTDQVVGACKEVGDNTVIAADWGHMEYINTQHHKLLAYTQARKICDKIIRRDPEVGAEELAKRVRDEMQGILDLQVISKTKLNEAYIHTVMHIRQMTEMPHMREVYVAPEDSRA
jgi:hypothetical protein